jgi:hypothetical protein
MMDYQILTLNVWCQLRNWPQNPIKEIVSMALNSKLRKSASRPEEPAQPAIDSFRVQHLNLAQPQVATELGQASVTVDLS